MIALLRLLSRLPLWALYRVSDLLYGVLYYVVRYRREVVRRNLERAFPEKPEAERRALARRFYRNFSDMLVEALKAWTISAEEIKRRVTVSNPELPERYLGQGQSMVVLAGHQCNGEWLLVACRLHFAHPVDAVYKPLHARRLDAAVNTSRMRFGVRMIPAQGAMTEILKDRRRTKAVALSADQSPTGDEEKYWTRFLGQETAFHPAPAKLARVTRNPVLFVRMRRVKRGHYELSFSVIAEPPYGKDAVPAILERYVAELERQIRERPAEWLWSHRRWKRQP